MHQSQEWSFEVKGSLSDDTEGHEVSWKWKWKGKWKSEWWHRGTQGFLKGHIDLDIINGFASQLKLIPQMCQIRSFQYASKRRLDWCDSGWNSKIVFGVAESVGDSIASLTASSLARDWNCWSQLGVQACFYHIVLAITLAKSLNFHWAFLGFWQWF